MALLLKSFLIDAPVDSAKEDQKGQVFPFNDDTVIIRSWSINQVPQGALVIVVYEEKSKVGQA